MIKWFSVMQILYHTLSVFFFFFSFIFISWRLITLQYYSGFCHTLTKISHGFTCIPHPDPPSHLPLHPHLPLSIRFSLGLKSSVNPLKKHNSEL